jgi:hypothetical protein
MKQTLLIITFFGLIFTINSLIKDNKVKTVTKTKVIYLHEEDFDTLSLQNVYHYLNWLGVDSIDIVMRQCILETGWLRHIPNNNLFGFSYGGQTIDFDNWKQSCMYYYCWQKRKYKGGCYYDFITKIGYASDPDYIKKLKGIDLRKMIKI